MRGKICMTVLSLAAAAIMAQSCRNRDLIPEDVMARIYYDMYMTDQGIKGNRHFDRLSDTLKVYEPIFNRYGKSVAAVWITGPEGRIGDDVIPSHGEAIKRCADEISHKLGYMN